MAEHKALHGWKDIALHVGRSVRTVQRWERSFGLPVHRPAGRDRSAVFALPAELDDWLAKAPAEALHSKDEAVHPKEEDAANFNYRILVVDDETAMRETAKQLLESEGHEVHTAANGFEALVRLQKGLPDLIISDLKMPEMSGFEFLSVVRRRFPHIGVIVISGAFTPQTLPASVLADAFLEKGNYTPQDLFTKVTELLQEAPIRPRVKPSETAVVWMVRGEADYIVLTCPYCLRTFSHAMPAGEEVQRIPCAYCPATVTFQMVP